MGERMTDENTKVNENNLRGIFDFSWRDFWHGFLKFWWLCLLLAVLAAGSAYFYSVKTYQPMYTASATYTVSTEKVSSGSMGISTFVYNYSRSTANQMSTIFPFILESDIMKQLICEDLQTERLPVKISSSSVEGTNMFTLNVTGKDPEKAYKVLQLSIKNFPQVAEFVLGKTDLTLLSETGVPDAPNNDNNFVKFSAMASICGFLLGLLWVLIYALFRNTIHSRQDVRRYLNCYCVGVLPQVSFKKHKLEIERTVNIKNPLVGNEFLEAVRSLRNNILHDASPNNHVIMVTSTVSSEGKTMASVNLALSAAMLEKKVLLIDADLRNDSVCKQLHFTPIIRDSLADYQIDSLEEEHLDVLTFRSAKRNVWKIINVDYLQSLLQKLREKYDYIIIDMPPAGVTPDPQIVCEVADAMLYVVRRDYVRVSKIKNVMSSLLSTDTKMLGCVLNCSEDRNMGHDYNGHYGHYRYSVHGEEM